VTGLPRAFGLYLDGNRIAALPREGQPDIAYFAATLDSLPYGRQPGARTLLLGAAGGFRVHEALGAGATAATFASRLCRSRICAEKSLLATFRRRTPFDHLLRK
jgi:hypothetical protein